MSGTGRERIASSSALFVTPPFLIRVTLVMAGGGELALPLLPPLPPLPTVINGVCCCAAVPNDLVFLTRLMWAMVVGGDGALPFDFRAASPSVGSGLGGIQGPKTPETCYHNKLLYG